MEKLRVHSGHKLNGTISVSSSKNAILPMLAGSVLCGEDVTLFNIPNFSDIGKMCEILTSLGGNIVKVGDTLHINNRDLNKFCVSYELGKDIRASIIFLGAILGRFKRCVIGEPGGCMIGSRPIDLHLKGLEAFGVNIKEEHGYLFCDSTNSKPCTFKFEKQSVGATENLMLFAVLQNGKTTLLNTAKEPEIVDLANFLNSMGAKIYGAGTNKIVIYGVPKLHGTNWKPIGDRIIAGTYLVGTAMAGGSVEICNINPKHLAIVLKKLRTSGCNLVVKNDRILLSAESRCKSLKSLTTGVYPKFPTDMQSVFLSLMSISNGSCLIKENLFDGRFKQVPELLKMGANIELFCNMAKVKGVEKLSGADVVATDLRAGASLVLAGLVADGYTTIDNVHYIDRGYDHIERDLSLLGAEIERI